MPRGYVLDNTYDAKRAIFRKLYSQEIKRLSGIIRKLDFYERDAYALIIGKINKGIYDNLSEDLYNKTYFGTKENIYIGKSKYAQDFMSPLELRMNTIAVKRIANILERSGNNTSLNYIMDMCYEIGSDIAYEFNNIKSLENEFDMSAKSPTLNVKPIIKKYDTALKMGTLPDLKLSNTKEGLYFKEKMANRMILAFNQVKARLMELGFTTTNSRKSAFACLNLGYYNVKGSIKNPLEITAGVIRNKDYGNYSLEELVVNYDKLNTALKYLEKVELNTDRNEIANGLYKVGMRAREMVIVKDNILPEMFDGFYREYVQFDKEVMQEQNK